MSHLSVFLDQCDTMELPYDLITRSGSTSDVVIPPMDESNMASKVHFVKFVFDSTDNDKFLKIQISSYIHQTEINRGDGS